MWPWARHRGVDPQNAIAALHDAETLLTGHVPIRQLWERAIEPSIRHDHSPYDTLFVALAIDRQTTLLTHDRALLERFSDHTTPLA